MYVSINTMIASGPEACVYIRLLGVAQEVMWEPHMKGDASARYHVYIVLWAPGQPVHQLASFVPQPAENRTSSPQREVKQKILIRTPIKWNLFTAVVHIFAVPMALCYFKVWL